LIHRDIKLSNILITAKELAIAKISDFGTIAQAKLKITNTRGTDLYLSPERMVEEDYDHKSDIWSLGIVMYQLVSGDSYPFDVKKSLTNIVLIHTAITANKRKQLPPQVSNEFSTLIWKMLEVDPTNRVSANDILNTSIVYDKANALSKIVLSDPKSKEIILNQLSTLPIHTQW
jgi:serine/threonine protein kinase